MTSETTEPGTATEVSGQVGQIVMCDINGCKDGIYHAVLGDGLKYRIEKISGEWFFSDGTGWKEKLDPEEITNIKYAGDLPEVKKDTTYENTYPLTDFFPKNGG